MTPVMPVDDGAGERAAVLRAVALAPDKLRAIEQEALRLAPSIASGAIARSDAADLLIEAANAHGLYARPRDRDDVEHVVRMGLAGQAAGAGHVPTPVLRHANGHDRANQTDGRGGRPEGATAAHVAIECMADVTPQPVRWVWPGRIAVGKLTLLAGEAGAGKSTAALDIAARITTGEAWPDGSRAPRGDVVILSAEDAVSDTIAPRLLAAGADRARAHAVRAVITPDGARRTFDLAADLAALDAAIKQIAGEVALIIIDPVTSYMGRIDSHRTTDVRRVLEPLAEYAERASIAVVAISHPPKSVPSKALHAVTGSYAYVAAARMVFLVVADPEDETRRLLLSAKNNLAPLPAGLGYRLAQRIVADGVIGSHILWDDAPVTITADQALAVARGEAAETAPTAADECAEFLRGLLAPGPMAVADVEREARAAGLLGATAPIGQSKPFRAARAKLGITSYQPSGARHAGWVWALPREGQMPSEVSDALPCVRASDLKQGI